MELTEIMKRLEECQFELEKLGAFGIDMFDNQKRHGARICVHMRNKDLPKGGKVVYDTSAYNDAVVKNVIIGDVAFFTLLDMDEAKNEGVFWGALI